MIFIKKIKKSDFFLNRIYLIYLLLFFFIWYIDIYIDVSICKLFQTCSIQIDLGSCLNRGYMIFAYIKCLYKDIRQCPQGLTPCSCIICLVKESMLCVCGCSSGNYCLPIGWISTCPGLCVL